MSTVGNPTAGVSGRNGQASQSGQNTSSPNSCPSVFAATTPSAPNLTIVIDGQPHSFPPALLAEEAQATDLRQTCEAAAMPPVVSIEHMLEWDDRDRWAAFQFVASLPRVQIHIPGADEEFANLFDAVLKIMVGAQDVARCGRGLRAAIEVAAIVHTNDIMPACNRIKSRLDELGISGQRVDVLVKQVRQLLPAVQQSQVEAAVDLCLVREILLDAPVPENTVIPPQWNVNLTGISAVTRDATGTPVVGSESEVLISAPILISQRLIDIQSKAVSLELLWRKDDRWQSRIVSRGKVASARLIVELAEFGLPVTTNNAAGLVEYLADFETHNLEVLPIGNTTQQLGWQGENCHSCFLTGSGLITATSNSPQPSVYLPTPILVPTTIIFRGADTGNDQLVAGLNRAGSLERWLTAVAPLAAFPRVRFAFYSSLAVPLLKVLKAANFAVSLSGPTSRGKTTALRGGASVWGNPDERSPAAALATWDSTRVWISRAAAVLNDHPLIIDDTKRARRPEDIAQVLYDITSGRDRGRGSQTGISESATWRTILITSGEAPLTSFSRDGGTRARVLELWGTPFGRADEQTAAIIAAVTNEISSNYGHAGPRFVQYLVDHTSEWEDYRRAYEILRDRYTARAGANPVAIRMADHFATLELCELLVHEAQCVPWPAAGVTDALWPELTCETSEADQAAVALRHVWAYACAHANDFFRDGDVTEAQPFRGWAGRWQRTRVPGNRWQYLEFVPAVLEEILDDAGFDRCAIVRMWRDRGWVKLDSEGKPRHKSRLGGSNVDLVAIKREAVEELVGKVEDEPTPMPPRPDYRQPAIASGGAVPDVEQKGNT